MRVHTVTIPAMNPQADIATALGGSDVATALGTLGTYDAIEREGVLLAFAPVPPAAPGQDELERVAQLGAGIAANVRAGLTAGAPVLMLGGNCNALVGVLAGFEGAYGADARIGLVWFDAHGDFNTPKTTRTGRLGGMPVAVAAGLAYRQWRATAGLGAPIPTDRIVMVDVRNLDPKERALIEATDVTVAAVSPGRDGVPLAEAVAELAARCDVIYLHVDEDILDQRFVPNHGTAEPDGPDIPTVQAAIRTVLATGKVRAFGLVSVYLAGVGADTSLVSAHALLTDGMRAWRDTAGAV